MELLDFFRGLLGLLPKAKTLAAKLRAAFATIRSLREQLAGVTELMTPDAVTLLNEVQAEVDAALAEEE